MHCLNEGELSPVLQLFPLLGSEEQLSLMHRLGFYHVWATLSCPEGLHFRLDLTKPEQRDVAKEVVKVGGLYLVITLALSIIASVCPLWLLRV